MVDLSICAHCPFPNSLLLFKAPFIRVIRVFLAIAVAALTGATAMAADRLVDAAQDIRSHLMGAARTLAAALEEPDGLVTV